MVENINRREMLKKLQEADFLALDLQLYLNTHPNCEKALKLYTETVNGAKELKKEFEEKYGPLTVWSTKNRTPWEWSRNPWTWEKERN